MTAISHLVAREILDSRGNPTLEVEVTDGTYTGRAAVPSGASTGAHEALDLRDQDPKRYNGKGVQKALTNVREIITPQLLGQNFDPAHQQKLDDWLCELDGTENKNRLGANAILGVSLANARLAAAQQNLPLWKFLQQISGTASVSLPRPMMNVINGGSHADSGLAIQEFMIFPKSDDFRENLRIGAEIFHTLKKILTQQKQVTSVGDEGGFAPHFPKVRQALQVLMTAIEQAGYAGQIELALDAAASEFFKNDVYEIDGQKLSSEELTSLYGELIREFPITSIEDSHDEDDHAGFAALTAAHGDSIQLVGDDLFVTNSQRLQQGIEQKLANAILIKVNQIGSLSETLAAIALAKKNNFNTIISHRSGETEDTFIADLAVGTDAKQIKTGSLSRTDRVAKYNQLLRISEELEAGA